MIKQIFILLLFVLLVWLSIDYFSITLPVDESIQKTKQPPESKTLKVTTYHADDMTPDGTAQTDMTLSELLQKGLFYDALAFYLEKNSVENMKQIEAYLAILSNTNTTLALEYMHVFLDEVPESHVLKLIIKTYIAQGDFPKAIEYIIQAKENYVSENEDKRLSVQLKDVALMHIDTLMRRKAYAELIAFLEDMIAYDSTDNYYKFRLAQLYMKLNKIEEASVLLDVLQYDEVYAQNVQTLLNVIGNEAQETYDYAIPLQSYGSHYTLNLFLDGTAFTLMLDTGATYIFIDEDKAAMLDVIRDDLVLQTAGNDVPAKLCNVSLLQVGNLELANVKVTVAPFKREGIDGLLGMNFFQQFTFFLDQEENVLYLNRK